MNGNPNDYKRRGEHMSNDATKACIRRIASEVKTERFRQEHLWGTEFDKKNTPNDWAAYIINYVAKATYAGRDETFTAEQFRANMMKVAAIAQAAVLVIDLHGSCYPRHYEGQPRSGANKMNDEADSNKDQVLKLIRAAWDGCPEDRLLQLLGSCFAAGDISHIDDEVLKENLTVLIDVEKQRKHEHLHCDDDNCGGE